jgi:hypothetical protein
MNTTERKKGQKSAVEKKTKLINLFYLVRENSNSSSLMMEAARTSETSVDNHFTRQYNPEDSSEHKLT